MANNELNILLAIQQNRVILQGMERQFCLLSLADMFASNDYLLCYKRLASYVILMSSFPFTYLFLAQKQVPSQMYLGVVRFFDNRFDLLDCKQDQESTAGLAAL